MSKTGLVVEGGGIRGIYASGVLDELLVRGIKVDGLVGVSAGIIHGISYVSEQYGRNIRYFLKYRSDKRFMSMQSYIKSGNVCNTEFCYDDIPYRLSRFDFETFKKNAEKIETYSTVSSLETGKAEYIRIYDLRDQMDVVRASASLPLISENVEYKGKLYLDGGSADSIPLKFMMNNGFEKNIVILTRPEGYVKKSDNLMPLMKLRYKDYPEYLKTCQKRHIMYNDELRLVEKEEKAGNAVVIRPSRDLGVGRADKDLEKIKRIYKLGRFDCQKILKDLEKLF
ncbi:MAG: patatin family protein [Eubacterium sp.]|nr:patatin family protein [Eubacterium sp.]